MSELILIGCAKTKHGGSYHLQAQDLYKSPLFAKRKLYAQETGQQWAILSALHGIVPPVQVLRPYEKTLQSSAAVQNLAAVVAFQLERSWAHVDAIEVHAGSLYVEAVLRACRKLEREVRVSTPLAGLGIGKQLAWYKGRS